MLVWHSGNEFTQLQEEVKVIKKANRKEQFFDLLPENFIYKNFIKLSKNIDISERFANRYMTEFCSKGPIGRIDQKTNLNLTLKPDDNDENVKLE